MTDRATESERQQSLTRLRRIEGQVRGIQRMIEEERDCEAIAAQLLAVRAALDKVSLHIMTHHIEQCLRGDTGVAERERLERVIGFFLRFAESDAAAAVDLDSERG